MKPRTIIFAVALGSAINTSVYATEPVFSWTGFYIGGNVGASISDGDYTTTPGGCAVTPPFCVNQDDLAVLTAHRDFDDTGFTGGGQVGFNYQLNSLLVGVETDINFDTFDETSRGTVFGGIGVPRTPYTVSNKLEWFGTVRGRAGVLVSPTLLLYGTGGFAYGEASSHTNVGPFPQGGDFYRGSKSETLTGWAAGGGGEWAFSSRWSAKLEYLFIDLDDTNYSNRCGGNPACEFLDPPPTYETEVETREHIIRVGINYRFSPAAAPLPESLK
jgi:outer membrane immunogenic protein